jgi:hypothetical protein
MVIPVPRHLNKKPLIFGLEPIELLGVASFLIGSNILAKFLSMSGLVPALAAGTAFLALKILKRGKARGHFIFIIRQQFRPLVKTGYPRRTHAG